MEARRIFREADSRAFSVTSDSRSALRLKIVRNVFEYLVPVALSLSPPIACRVHYIFFATSSSNSASE
jgi:hypothetical protein